MNDVVVLSAVEPAFEEFHAVPLNDLLLLTPKEGRVRTRKLLSKGFGCYLTDKRAQMSDSEPDVVSSFPPLANLRVRRTFTHSGTRCTEHHR